MQWKVQVLNLFIPLVDLKTIFKPELGVKICFQISRIKCLIGSYYPENIVQIFFKIVKDYCEQKEKIKEQVLTIITVANSTC